MYKAEVQRHLLNNTKPDSFEKDVRKLKQNLEKRGRKNAQEVPIYNEELREDYIKQLSGRSRTDNAPVRYKQNDEVHRAFWDAFLRWAEAENPTVKKHYQRAFNELVGTKLR